MDQQLNNYITRAGEWAFDFVPKLILAIIVLWVGMKIVSKISKMVGFSLQKASIDTEIEEFLKSVIDVVLKVIVILLAASVIGIKLSALFGLLAAAGFAIGLALQGFLGNFASGLTIIFFKPYKVGDWVQVSDSFGKVKSIEIFSTNLITPGDKTLIIPNGQITDNIITNFSTRGKIRLELTVTMPYEESFPHIKKVIGEALAKVDYVLPDPPPQIGIESYDSHSIIIGVKPYILPDNFWDATHMIYAEIKKSFSNENIRVAYSEGVELGPIGG